MTNNLNGNTETAVLMTYSTVLREGATAPEPSRLSELAALGAAHLLNAEGGSGRLLIAGEQSYDDFPFSTGDLLSKQSHLMPVNFRPVLLNSPEGRNINTPQQIERLVDYCQADNIRALTVFGWAFHGIRVLRLFEAYDSDIRITYRPIEEGLFTMAPEELQPHLDAMGLEVDILTILQRGIKKYQRREWFTRQSLLFGARGGMLNFLSRAGGNQGRFDDLHPDGRAQWGTTGSIGPLKISIEDGFSQKETSELPTEVTTAD